MQVQNIEIVENSESQLREIPKSNLKQFFIDMEIGTKETAYHVPLLRAATIRALMSNIKAYTGKIFLSEKIENGDIIIWRAE